MLEFPLFGLFVFLPVLLLLIAVVNFFHASDISFTCVHHKHKQQMFPFQNRTSVLPLDPPVASQNSGASTLGKAIFQFFLWQRSATNNFKFHSVFIGSSRPWSFDFKLIFVYFFISFCFHFGFFCFSFTFTAFFVSAEFNLKF